MYRFQEAWIVALLTADALLTMPPEGTRFEGADAIDGDQITGIIGFPRQLELFGRFGLPAEIAG